MMMATEKWFMNPIGSVLRRFSHLTLSTADEKAYTLKQNILTRLALFVIGVPHLGFRARAGIILGELKNVSDGHFLEAGCGYGIIALTLAEGGRTVTAIDVAPERVDEIKHMLAEAPDLEKRITLRTESLTALSFPNASFDYVSCSEVIEHIADDRRAVSELARVLKPGGTLLLSVPYNSAYNKKIYRRFGHERPGYSRKDLEALLAPHGITITHEWFYERLLGTVLFEIFNRVTWKPAMALLFYPFYWLYLLDAAVKIGEPNGIVIKAVKNR